MAKKDFNKALKEQQQQLFKTDGIETAKARLSKRTLGKRETKDTFIKMRATSEERERWNEYAKSQNRTLTDIIREMLNDRIGLN